LRSWGTVHFSGHLKEEMINDVSGSHFEQRLSQSMKMTISKSSSFKRRKRVFDDDERIGKIDAIDGKKVREDFRGNRLDNGSTEESIPS
jgi:hypothetical protein